MSMRSHFLQHIAQTSPSPMGLQIDRSEGMYLWDTTGKKYMDMISGIGVSSLGHQHPAVVSAVKNQVDRYMHTLVYGEFILQPQVDYAKKLTALLPESLNAIYFVNSGAEAVEGALKLAKRYTGRPNIVSCFQSYHGSTTGAMALNSEAYFHQNYRPLMPGVQHMRMNEVSDLDCITEQTAAVVIEPIQAERGVFSANKAFLQAVRAKTKEVGALLIFDEIQTGFGRTGFLFAFQKFGVTPDILLVAKGMGGGMPIGGFISDQKILQVFTENPVLGHITTFGGHPVNCAAALATLEVLTSGDLISSVAAKAAVMKSMLDHDKIVDLRVEGLWAAVEFESAETMFKIVEIGLQKGYIYDWFLFNDKAIRIAPPLIITMEELRIALADFNLILDEL